MLTRALFNSCLFLFLVGMGMVHQVSAQSDTSALVKSGEEILLSRKSGFSLDLFTGGTLGSITYERFFTPYKKGFYSVGIGMGESTDWSICFADNCGKSINTFALNQHITYNIGQSRHLIECGLGATYIVGYEYFIYSIFGFRVLPKSKTLGMARASLHIPISGGGILWTEEGFIFVPFGISFGATF